MTDHIFAGPSLAGIARPPLADTRWHPPAKGGDLLQLDLRAGDRVCLIDGVFESAPAVRHKEILLLLASHIAVFGASSMGALRAAEMARYGMTGVGRIYCAFARGVFTRDDWVALRHAPAEMDCQPLTLALADLIFGLQHAVREKALSARQAGRLLRAGAGIFYQDRDWARIESASALGNNILESFRTWRAGRWRSQKREDALACLSLLTSCRDEPNIRPEYVDTPFLRNFATASGIDLARSNFGVTNQNIL
ncbi:hypothetical protein SAMN02745824_2317 [Parasphingorhabdus marina DSM 22363]|uniref:TfuA-like core domain-containing protein n=1 Tax=Parasphingorhabdus marina DSM 22363 TaxID=1123272 RepID=A0A1N6FAY0_9SPHN|nr:TfuA-like protein [Parasphingorhabdus marina]SIN92433.1 hypothetical protein SAMN02745824_2317 [Parasphingorhabdus marina DSM 22363]